jgi:hypothetical protein
VDGIRKRLAGYVLLRDLWLCAASALIDLHGRSLGCPAVPQNNRCF